MALNLILDGEVIMLDRNLITEKSEDTTVINKNNPLKEERFVEKESDSLSLTGYRILVDTVTGVNYLETSKGGITPLLSKNGEVCIDKRKSRN